MFGDDEFLDTRSLFHSPARVNDTGAVDFSVSPIQFNIAELLNQKDDEHFVDVEWSPQCAVAVDKTPAGLFAVAIHIDSPELNFPWSGKRQRLMGKQSKSIGEVLCDLQRDATQTFDWERPWPQRQRGRNLFRRVYCEHSDSATRQSEAIVSQVWQDASKSDQSKWTFLAEVHEQLYDCSPGSARKMGKRERVLLPDGNKYVSLSAPGDNTIDPLITETYGALLTYHSSFGLDDPLVIAWEKGLDSDSVLQKLKGLQKYQQQFEVFKKFVTGMMRDHRFKNCAVAMELCMNGLRKGRIHFHGFLGQECSYNGWMAHPVKATLRRSHLIFENVFPNLQVMRCSGRRGMEMPTAHGLYYCMAPKIGQMFSWSTLIPFKDNMLVVIYHLHLLCNVTHVASSVWPW